jgi:hypothetical protein
MPGVWNNPATFNPGQIVNATDFNKYVRDNPAYLFSRPLETALIDNGASYTTTSDTFVDLDATKASKTFTPYGTKIFLIFCGVMLWQAGDAVGAAFDFTIDSTRLGVAGTSGLMAMFPTAVSTEMGFCYFGVATVTANASHTFRVQWRRRTSGTAYLASGDGVSNRDYIPSFEALEVG